MVLLRKRDVSILEGFPWRFILESIWGVLGVISVEKNPAAYSNASRATDYSVWILQRILKYQGLTLQETFALMAVTVGNYIMVTPRLAK